MQWIAAIVSAGSCPFSPRTRTPRSTAVADWLKAKPGARAAAQVFRLFGYAGTGKTTLAKHIAEGVDGKVLFAAFTGKAAHGHAQQGLRAAPPPSTA